MFTIKLHEFGRFVRWTLENHFENRNFTPCKVHDKKDKFVNFSMEEWRSREVHDKPELIFPTKDGDKRTYSYVVGLSSSSEPNWNDLIFLAKLIPRILHNVNRVCYVFGGPVQYQITDITHTTINKYVLEQLREADAIGNEIIIQAGLHRVISQMPIVLIPVHFDRDPTNRTPSCCRSIVLRPFLTNDFMTGVPVIPGSLQLPTQVLHNIVHEISKLDGISRVLYDLTSKPPGTTEWE